MAVVLNSCAEGVELGAEGGGMSCCGTSRLCASSVDLRLRGEWGGSFLEAGNCAVFNGGGERSRISFVVPTASFRCVDTFWESLSLFETARCGRAAGGREGVLASEGAGLEGGAPVSEDAV